MVVLIDNGHGRNTPGKRSPDSSFFEYKWNRAIAHGIVDELCSFGYDARLVVPEEEDVPLKERVRRINSCCSKYGCKNVIMVSIHANAAGDGSGWMNAKGWSVYTTPGVTRSDDLATCLFNAAKRYMPERKMRADWSDGDPDWEANFYIIKGSNCPAVLTESFFYDNPDDLAYMTNPNNMKKIISAHVDGVIDYLAKFV